MIKQYVFILLINILTTLLSLGQQPLNNFSPEDFKLLEEHIVKNIRYPDDARQKDIQGIVYVVFKIDASGVISTNSVKTLFGLSTSCDQEAERVIKSYNKKWSIPTSDVIQPYFIIPIKFKLTDSSIHFPDHIINVPIRTVVLPKSIKSKKSSWTVYSGKGFENSISEIHPGDTVTVTGWAAWCYFVQTRNVTGYISYQALEINSPMEALEKILKDQSPAEEKAESEAREASKRQSHVDTIRNFSSTDAHLSLSVTKKDIYVGECTTVTLAFNVRKNNKLALQFYELGEQLSKICTTSLNFADVFTTSSQVTDIVGLQKTIGDEMHTTYKIYESAFCPSTTNEMQFPAIKLKMLILDAKTKKTEKVAEFRSSPITVKIKPLQPPYAMKHGRFHIVGEFALKDSIEANNITVNKPFIYQITLSGHGFIPPTDPFKLPIPSFQCELQDLHMDERFVDNDLHSSKTFIYKITPKTAGTYDFGSIFNYSFYNPHSGKKETIKSSKKVLVSKENSSPIRNEKTYLNNSFILIDASQSMMIEDYIPNRLHVAKEAVKGLLLSRPNCDIGLITFAGEATLIARNDFHSCYSSARIDSIKVMHKKGTAIGDAIWKASMLINHAPGIKKIIIIGDGENTTGSISAQLAAELAKESNIKIYTIGIGTKGLAPYGRDFFGRPQMVENTFSDIDFIKISKITGGEYYYARNKEEIEKTLHGIFSR